MGIKRVEKNKRKVKLMPFLGRFSPKIEFSDTFYQKGLGGGTLFDGSWTFNPNHYEGETPKERRDAAYQDAKQHADFYKELIGKGIYPEETKIKVKRKSHSDNYIVEFFMPHIREINPVITEHPLTGKKFYRKDLDELKENAHSLKEKMEETSRGYGHKFGFNEDPGHIRNYGIDDEGELRYIDTEILDRKLPFDKRLPKSERISWKRKQKIKEGIEKMRLEERVLPVSTLLSFVLALFFLSSNITGNVIGNLDINSTNPLGIALIMVSILFGYLYFKEF